MSIQINIPNVLAALADGQRNMEAQGGTLGEAVADVAARYPKLAPRLRDDHGNPYKFVVFYVNDEDSRFHGGFEAKLQDGDEVTIVPAISGG
ncbi:MAG TPA: MoaD/ThiS family protein [Gemmatimonadales bacterium]|jgi:molybdopterin converting factor small subunit|nr:MoaD/ThiS family protein [Gemmatimonadales bacterium]